jgi:NDP-sugar pyrophosphorylase family protein
MQAVILAGGLGTRMRPYTEKAPKCLLPVHGRPFVDYQLELLKSGGVREVVLCLGYLGEMVQSHLGDGASRGLSIQYSWDAANCGGTAGALKQAEPLLDNAFFVTWGDSYVRVDHAAMMEAHRRSAPGIAGTMSVYRNENAYDSSNVQIEGNKVRLYGKGLSHLHLTYIDAGISVFEKSALKEIPSDRDSALDPFFTAWAASGRLGAYVLAQRFYEVGSWGGLAEFEQFIANGGDAKA